MLVLVPGLISDGAVWAGLRARLPAELPVHLADVTRDATIEAMAARALSLPGRLVVLGHSMGGRVAMEMARQAPERIAGLGLLNTGLHPARPGEAERREALIRLAHEEGMAALADRWLPGMLAQGLPPDPAVMADLTAMVLRMSPEIHERQMRALLARPDAAATIGAFMGPMLLLTGRQDSWSPVAQHEEIQGLCPQARLEIVENAGHFAPVEQAARVAALLSDWVQETSR